jgi:hypothetical protein
METVSSPVLIPWTESQYTHWLTHVAAHVEHCCRQEAERRAAMPTKKRTLYMFASTLGKAGIKKFILRFCPEAVVTSCQRLSAHHWMVRFVTPDMAQEAIRACHGRYPFPARGFPYFDRHIYERHGLEEITYRLDLRYANNRRRVAKEDDD